MKRKNEGTKSIVKNVDSLDPTQMKMAESDEKTVVPASGKPKKKRAFSLYQKASGKPGKKFLAKEFLALTKTAKKKPGGFNTALTQKLSDGYVYHADSKQEIKVLQKLQKNNAFWKLRGQCIDIPYKHERKIHHYYPDFVVLTHTNRIVLVEVKEAVQMNTEEVQRKYKAMERYCLKRGYLYLMCDKKLTTYSDLQYKPIKGIVKEAIETAIKQKGYFNRRDYEKMIKDKEHRESIKYGTPSVPMSNHIRE